MVGCKAVDQNTGGAPNSMSELVTLNSTSIHHRFVAIDNVCAWPNLTVLNDGTIIATIFNQPSHARREGDVECWASTDGHFWEKRGTAAVHEPGTNRMNVAAGLSHSGDLIVLASGWSLQPAPVAGNAPSLVNVLRPWVSRSSDGGRSWTVDKVAFPAAEPAMTEFVPFGDIVSAADRSLRVLAYAQSQDKVTNKVSLFRSDDDGHTWTLMTVISDRHNETALLRLGEATWIAAARQRNKAQALDLFRSDDDGQSWKLVQPLTQANQHPGHLLQLDDGRLLLTYGNRIADQFGVAAKVSDDGGATWSDEITVISDLGNRDVGYPASVQVEAGILTAYYASSVASHQRYHMGVVSWKLEARQPSQDDRQ